MHLQVPAPLSTSSRILLLVYLALHGTVYGSYLATVVPEKRLGGGRGNLSTSFPSATLPLQYLPVCRPGSWLGNPVVTAASCSQTCNALSPCKMLQITLTFCSTGQFVLQCSTVIRTAMHGLSAVLSRLGADCAVVPEVWAGGKLGYCLVCSTQMYCPS